MRLSTTALATLLALPALAAYRPIRLAAESAQVTLGPGIEPPAGTAPFQTRLEAAFNITGLPKGTPYRFRFWRAGGPALKSLPQGQPLPAKPTGFIPVEGEVAEPEPNHRFQLTALVKEPWHGPESLVIELIVKGRLAGRVITPIVERYLPSSRPKPSAQDPRS